MDQPSYNSSSIYIQSCLRMDCGRLSGFLFLLGHWSQTQPADPSPVNLHTTWDIEVERFSKRQRKDTEGATANPPWAEFKSQVPGQMQPVQIPSHFSSFSQLFNSSLSTLLFHVWLFLSCDASFIFGQLQGETPPPPPTSPPVPSLPRHRIPSAQTHSTHTHTNSSPQVTIIDVLEDNMWHHCFVLILRSTVCVTHQCSLVASTFARLQLQLDTYLKY